MELPENLPTCTPIGISTHVKRISGLQTQKIICAINNAATKICKLCLVIAGIDPKTFSNGSMQIIIGINY